MRNIRVALCGLTVLLLLFTGCAKKPFFKAGDPVTLKNATPVEQLKAKPKEFEGKRVLVEGTVAGVCRGSGCWALIETSPSGEKVYAKSVDHSVLLPTDCEGAWIRVEGEVVLVGAPAAEEKRCDAHGHGKEGEAHVCPQPDCFVSLAAVELVDK